MVLSVLKSLFWSFMAKPILMKGCFLLLEIAAAKTDNRLDDEIVREAKARYYQQGDTEKVKIKVDG